MYMYYHNYGLTKKAPAGTMNCLTQGRIQDIKGGGGSYMYTK